MSVLFGLVLALAGQDDPLKQDIDNAIKRLSQQGSLDSFSARLELEEIGRRAVPALVAELGRSDASAAAKRAACEALGRIRDPHKDAIAALVAKLKDGDEYGESVAAAAARALGLIGDASASAALIDVLKSKAVDTDKVLKAETIKALGILRAKDAAELLRKALDDKKTASVAENDDVAPLVAAAAADALGLIRSKEAVDDLSAKIADETVNPATTQKLGVHAARALQRILAAELKDDGRAGTLAGTAEETTKTLEAWKKWWDGLKTKKDVDETKSRLGKISAAVEAYKKSQGKFPSVLEDLVKAPKDAKDYPKDGFYQGELKDAWGRGLYYRQPGTGAEFDVLSWGKDGAAWGSGDNADLYHHDKWADAKKAETKKVIDETVAILNKFKADHERLPDSLIDLMIKPNKYPLKKDWPQGGYVKEGPRDGFGFELRYKMPGTGGEAFDLISYGADNKEGGEGVDADVWNHDKRPPAPPKEEPKKDAPKEPPKK
ncbi:MAG TPA: type II secretion system protein GspG [Planctomycetota bacterium]